MCSGCHAGHRPGPLGPDRHRDVEQGEREERDQAGGLREREPEQPQRLHDETPTAYRMATARRDGSSRGRPQPLRDQRHPHDHVADRDHGEVVVLERGRDAGREHQHAGDLHQREQPVDDVVGVVRGGEPAEVHPGPPDGEEHHQVVAERGGDVVLGHPVGQLGRDRGHADHEAEVEQQLQRGGRPVRLVGIAAGERAAPGHTDCSGHPRSLSVPQDSLNDPGTPIGAARTPAARRRGHAHGRAAGRRPTTGRGGRRRLAETAAGS